jgi:hypothetical protein
MGRGKGIAGLTGAVALSLVLGLIAAPALAKATYKLKLEVPRHPKVGTSYTASGLLYLNHGAEVLGVFYDKKRCSNSYSTELRRSEASDYNAGNLALVSAQGQFSQSFNFVKFARKAHNLCGYLAHTVGSVPKYHTDRVVKLRYST